MRAQLTFAASDIPPLPRLRGVDLVTEGVITINRVVEYAKDALGENRLYEKWSFGHDGVSRSAVCCLRKRI